MTRRTPIAAVLTVLVFVFLYGPIAVIFTNSVNADGDLLTWGGFTLEWFGDVLADGEVIEAFITSFTLAIAVAVISVLIAIGSVFGMRRMPRGVQNATEAVTFLRIVLPEIVFAIAIFLVTRMIGIPLGAGLVIASEVVFCSAYAVIVLQARMSALPETLEQAAADLGAPPLRALWRVIVPQLTPSIIVAALLAFTFSLDDVVSATFLGGSRLQTLPVMLMGLIRHGSTAEVNAIAVLVMLASLIPLLAALAVIGVRGVSAVGAGTSRPNDKNPTS